MTRRLQLLLDEDRMRRLERRASASGRSVASLIRSAIDVAYPEVDVEARRAAGDRLLALEPLPIEADWQELKRLERASLLDER